MDIKELNKRASAAEIFTTSVCNMNCSYCFIKQNKELSDLQKNINGWIDGGVFIGKLKKLYGEKNLEHLSFWGAEPTVSLERLDDAFEDIMVSFPNLDSLSFSSNFYSNVEKIISFLKKIDKTSHNLERDLEFDLQISLDGPKDITDENRMSDATGKIIYNFKKLVDFLKTYNMKNLDFTMGFKPTVSMDNMRDYYDKERIIEYFDFFDRLYDIVPDKTENQRYFSGKPLMTLVVPGEYTSSDGRLYAQFFKNLFGVSRVNNREGIFKNFRGSLNSYYYRLLNTLRFIDDYTAKPSMFTCSGGDSNFGIDFKDQVHICHRTFQYGDEKYNSVLPEDELKIKDRMERTILKNPDNEFENIKWHYRMRGYHDFIRLRMSQVAASTKELALAGQADRVYLENDRLLELFSLFMINSFSCPLDGNQNTTTHYFTPLPLIRLFSNGAFRELLREFRHNVYGGDFGG